MPWLNIESATGLLVAVAVSTNYYIEINCFPDSPYSLARNGAEIEFEVNNRGEIIDVSFPFTTGDESVDMLFNDASFKRAYIDWVQSEVPEI